MVHIEPVSTKIPSELLETWRNINVQRTLFTFTESIHEVVLTWYDYLLILFPSNSMATEKEIYQWVIEWPIDNILTILQ